MTTFSVRVRDILGHKCLLPRGCIAPLMDCFLHGGLDRLKVMCTSFSSGNFSSDIFSDRNEKSCFFLSTLARNFFQFPGTLTVADTRCLVPVPRFPLFPPFITSARYWSQTISALDDRSNSWRTLGQKRCRNMNQKSCFGYLYQELNVSVLHRQ